MTSKSNTSITLRESEQIQNKFSFVDLFKNIDKSFTTMNNPYKLSGSINSH